MADNTEAEVTPGHSAPHRVSKMDPGVMVEGIFELMRSTLSEVLKPDVVDRALDKARKQPAVKAMLLQAKSKGSSAAAKAARGPSTIRSNYNLFTQECFHALKGANIQVGIIEVGSLWNVLPEQVKADFNKRYGGVRCVHPAVVLFRAAAICRGLAAASSCLCMVPGFPPSSYALTPAHCPVATTHVAAAVVIALSCREAYNAKIIAGTPAVLSDEVAAYEAAQDLEPVDYVKLYHQYKAAAAAAVEAKVKVGVCCRKHDFASGDRPLLGFLQLVSLKRCLYRTDQPIGSHCSIRMKERDLAPA